MGQVDDQQMPGQEQMAFAKLSRKEARERIDRYLSLKSVWMGLDLTLPEQKDVAVRVLFDALEKMGVVEGVL